MPRKYNISDKVLIEWDHVTVDIIWLFTQLFTTKEPTHKSGMVLYNFKGLNKEFKSFYRKGQIKNNLIMFAGKAQSGKNTSADLLTLLIESVFDKCVLEETLLYKVNPYKQQLKNLGTTKHFSFAALLKDTVKELFWIDSVYSDSTDGKNKIDHRWTKTVRQILQLFGTEVGRQIHEDVWAANLVKELLKRRYLIPQDFTFSNIDFSLEKTFAAFREYETTSSLHTSVVTDLRFKNELDFVKKHLSNDYNIFSVYVEGGCLKDKLDLSEQTHASENGIKASDCDFILQNTGTIDDLAINIGKLYTKIWEKIVADNK